MKNNILKWLSDVVGKHKIKIAVLCIVQAVLGGCGVPIAALFEQEFTLLGGRFCVLKWSLGFS